MFAPKDELRARPLSPLLRGVTYGLAGCLLELLFTGLTGLRHHPAHRPRTSPLMFPIYALMLPFFEPAHDWMRGRLTGPLRALAYGAGFTTIEYASGKILRLLAVAAPWDYRHARLHVDGLVRADYVPLWAIAGLAAERLHDRLMRRPPAPVR